jgi:H+/Cl- antiporter ClcA
VAALGGGFGAVFGVPLAGAVFALEVQSVGRVRYEALVPALTASIVGDLMVGALGHDHAVRLLPVIDVDAWVLARVALAGVAFGLAGAVFAGAVHRPSERLRAVGDLATAASRSSAVRPWWRSPCCSPATTSGCPCRWWTQPWPVTTPGCRWRRSSCCSRWSPSGRGSSVAR